MKSEAYVNVGTNSGDKAWKGISVPLNAITGLARTNKIVRDIAFSGDATATFFVGEIRVVSDTTPITGEVNVREVNLALGDELELKGTGFGGASILKYSWDFDDKDGIQEDAEGQVVKRKFRVPGKYTVTLTITDQYGLKKPYKTSLKVTVNPLTNPKQAS